MGHTHPYQAKIYPSFEDIVYPLFQHGNNHHLNNYYYTFTSIGYYVSIYEKPNKLKKPKNYTEFKNHIETSKFGGLYILTKGNETQLQDISNNLIIHINNTCEIVSDYINKTFGVSGYSLIFVPLKSFYVKKNNSKRSKKNNSKRSLRRCLSVHFLCSWRFILHTRLFASFSSPVYSESYGVLISNKVIIIFYI